MWIRVLLMMLSQALLLPLCADGRFYIGRYKTVPVERSEDVSGRKMPYIIYADDEENAIETIEPFGGNRRIERPPIPHRYHYYDKTQRLNIGPPTLFGPASTYGNNKENGYVVVSHKDIGYVVPPFTPGGRVNVAFQFWIPISIGGFFVTGRDIEKALRSDNPTSYIASLFLKHLATNATASDLLGDLTSPILEQSIQTFLDWVVPYFEPFAGDDSSSDPLLMDSRSKIKTRHKRNVESDDGGWVTIGKGMHNSQSVDYGGEQTHTIHDTPPLHASVKRVLWSDGHVLADNSIASYDSDRRPDLDLSINADPANVRPRPFSSRPTSSSSRPTLSYKPSITSIPSVSEVRPPFHLTSFDDLPSSTTNNNKVLDVPMRLSRLDYFFSNLHLDHEECRRRVLCEVAREPETFSPLSEVINGETKIPGDMRELSRELLNTAEGARLLSYIEAVRLGEDKSQQCDVHRYRCRTRASDIINTDVLPIWREVVRWLTVKVLTQDANSF